MIKAILYKEWIKSRWYLLVAFVVMTSFSGYALVKLYRAVSLMGAAHIWEVMVTRNAVFVDQMQYVPLLVGLLLAVVQFVPEMQRKCIKLTLHLPIPLYATVGTMLVYGVVALSVIYLMNLLLLYGFTIPVLASELVANIVGTVLPWYLAGVAAYLLGCWVILEPTWRLRLVEMFMAVLLLRIWFLGSVPCAFGNFLYVMSFVTLLSASLAWFSVSRFVEGRQD